MNMRTLQIFGQGYGSSPTTVSVSAGGNTIYTGPVPTVNEPIPNTRPPNTLPIITTYDVDITLQGEIPMTVEVTSGILIIGDVLGNYANVYTTVGNVTIVTSSGPNTFLSVNNFHNNLDPALQDVRQNVAINGVPISITRPAGATGTWSYQLEDGDTLTCLLDLDSGTE